MGKIALVVALFATALLPPAPAAQARCADVRVPLRNLKLEAKWKRPRVRIGDTAVLKIHVTRTAEEDPVTEEGIPYPNGRPMNEPVEGVELGLGLYIGDVFFNGGAISNAAGRADLPVKIHSHAEPGTGTISLYAEKRHTPPDFPSPSCRVIVYEWAHIEPNPKLDVVRP